MRDGYQGIVHYGVQAALVDVPHRERVDTSAPDIFALLLVQRANAYEGNAGGIDFRMETQKVHQLRWTLAHAAGERHSMDIAAGARLRGVHIGMRVDPEQTNLPVALPVMGGYAGHRARRNRMVAAEHDGGAVFLKRFAH